MGLHLSNCKNVIVVLLCATFVTVGYIALIFVLISQNYLLNEHYSAKTVHLHKVMPNAPYPMEWNSLGYMTPYAEQQFGARTWEPTTYFLHEGSTKAKTRENFLDDPLSDPFSYTMYINSERSFSILSSISPLVYLATLIVICNISLLYFLFAYMSINFKTSSNKKEICGFEMSTVRNVLCYVTLLVYGFYLFGIFGAGALVKRQTWEILDVEYFTSPQIPSVVYNIIVLAIYCVYLKRKDSYWELLFGTETSNQDDTQRLVDTPVLVDPTFKPPGQAFYAKQFTAPQLYQESRANMHNIQLDSMYNPAWNMMPGHKQQLLMSTSGIVTQKGVKAQRTYGPISNEFNVIVCVIFLLGGIANLAMSKAFLMETEAQLVIISLFMFCVLELGRNHLVSYFWFLSAHLDNVLSSPDDKTDRYIIVFIDLVVFLLQLFIVVIWQMTLTSLLTIAPTNVWVFRDVMIFVISCFLLTRCISVVQGLFEVYWPSSCCGSDCCCKCDCMSCFSYDDSKWQTKILYYLELVMYCLIVWIIFGLFFLIAMPDAGLTWNNSEKKLIFLEQMMYQNTDVPIMSSACNHGIQRNELIAKIHHLCTDRSSDLYKIRPVTLKVFAWTRFFVLQHEVVDHVPAAASADVLFCSNGFEQHWGQCKSQFLNPADYSAPWITEVKKSAGV